MRQALQEIVKGIIRECGLSFHSPRQMEEVDGWLTYRGRKASIVELEEDLAWKVRRIMEAVELQAEIEAVLNARADLIESIGGRKLLMNTRL